MQIVLISSDSKILMDEKIKEIVNNKETITYNALESSIKDILEEASHISLFQDEKYLVIKNADYFGKGKIGEKESDILKEYLENPSPYTTILFTTYESIDKRKNITKYILENHKYYEIKAPKNYDLLLEVKKRLQKYQIGEQSIKYMIDACLGNYDLVINEINKLTNYFKVNEPITLEIIKQIVVSNLNDNIFKFSEAVISKDLKESIRIYEELLKLKIDSSQIIMTLVREYRLLFLYKILEEKRYTNKDIAGELKLQDWQISKLQKNATNYHKDDLRDYLLKLSYIDYEIKSGFQDKNMALYPFLIEILEM